MAHSLSGQYIPWFLYNVVLYTVLSVYVRPVYEPVIRKEKNTNKETYKLKTNNQTERLTEKNR